MNSVEVSKPIPKELASIMGNLVKQILKHQPKDIEKFAYEFFSTYDEVIYFILE